MLGKVMAIIGCLTQLAPVVGLSMTLHQVLGVMLDNLTAGRALPLSEVMGLFGDAMGPTLWTCAFSIVGYVPLYLAIWVYKYRAPWFFWSLVLVAANIIALFPFGTIMGGFIGRHCLKCRDEYMATTRSAHSTKPSA